MDAQVADAKSVKFRAIAQKRVNGLFAAIKRLGNLSRRTSYAYTAPEIEQMFKALRHELDEAEAKFGEQKATVFNFE